MSDFRFSRMLENDRLAEMLYQDVIGSNDGDPELIDRLRQYAEAYARYNTLTEEDVSKHYQMFASSFMRDLKAFDKDGKYPVQRGETDRTVERIRYDVALLLEYPHFLDFG